LIASAASVALLAFLLYRIPHWLAHLPPTFGWWYAVRHEYYPSDLLLCVVLLTVLVPACLFGWGERFLDQVRYGKNFVDSYTPSERRKQQIAQRARANLCPACGYDVRQSSLICPECGGPIRRLSTPTPPRRSASPPRPPQSAIPVRVRRRAS
jgi:hypothetical protein